ncbi:histidine phosphatase family protein [Gluconacetobacter azotocaptans]|nr:histidine phosphatase family protein [Gluconacetobacter azotocaptans]MBM9400107.1 histidine phosphatase family protein [Gluconacetobacter azotocaptans]
MLVHDDASQLAGSDRWSHRLPVSNLPGATDPWRQARRRRGGRMKLFGIASGLSDDVRRGIIPARDSTDGHDESVAAWLNATGDHHPIVAGPDVALTSAQSCRERPIVTEPALRERGHGQWHGRNLRDLSPDDVRRWVDDPDFAPPGGESGRAAFERIGDWLDHLPDGTGTLIVIARPAVIRMLLIRALGSGTDMIRHLDVPPSTRSEMSRHTGWRVSAIGVPLG